MEIKIERLANSDWKKFYSLFQEVVANDFSHYPSPVIQRFLERKRIKKGLGERKEIFLARKGRKVVGFLVAIDEGAGVSFGNWLGVGKAFRRLGIGRALVGAWEEWAEKGGCHKLRALTSLAQNKGFYQKIGFELEGVEKKSHYGLDRFIFGKIIGEVKQA